MIHTGLTWQHIFSGVAILGSVYFEGAGGSWRATMNGGIQFLNGDAAMVCYRYS